MQRFVVVSDMQNSFFIRFKTTVTQFYLSNLSCNGKRNSCIVKDVHNFLWLQIPNIYSPNTFALTVYETAFLRSHCKIYRCCNLEGVFVLLNGQIHEGQRRRNRGHGEHGGFWHVQGIYSCFWEEFNHLYSRIGW